MKRMVDNAEKTNNLMRTTFVLPDSLLIDNETYQDASKTKEGQILINFCNEVKKTSFKLASLSENVNNIEKVKNYPLGIVTTENRCYLIEIAYDTPNEIYLYSISSNAIYSVYILYERDRDIITITSTNEIFISEDNVKTLFGNQSIIGTGNIDLYRHQMTITNANDVSVVYIVDASNNSVVNTLEKFVTVTKANTSYTGLASYLDASGDIQPAFIRYSAGNVVIQLQNGSISPMKSVSDIVTPL